MGPPAITPSSPLVSRLPGLDPWMLEGERGPRARLEGSSWSQGPGPATGNGWGGLHVGAALASKSRTEARRAERDSGRGSSRKTLAQHLWLLDTEEGLLQTPHFTCRGTAQLPAQRGREAARSQPPGATELAAGPAACLLPAARVSGGGGGSGEPQPHERRAPLVSLGSSESSSHPGNLGTSSSRTEG